MASITCKHGVEHKHSSVEESRRCWQGPPLVPAAPVPASPPPPPPKFQDWRDKARTDTQLIKVRELNGDVIFAMKLTRGECSDYIDALIHGRPYVPTTVQVVPVPAPAPTPPRRSAVTDDPRLTMIGGMIRMIPEGYYATAPDGENRHNDFVRIITQKGKRSHWNGALTVQTQHSDAWSEPKLVLWPSGKWSKYDGGEGAISMVQEIIADYKTAALRYSILKTRCMRCGKKLTDDRSKHYLVGPECEVKHNFVWPIDFADEQNGLTFEELRHSGRPYNQHHGQLGRRVA